jgi:hypothetical protein
LATSMMALSALGNSTAAFYCVRSSCPLFETPNVRLQPRRLTIAPAAAGCKPC